MKKSLFETFKRIGGFRLNENLLVKRLMTDKKVYKELEKFDHFGDFGIDQEGGGIRQTVTVRYTTGPDAEGNFAEVKSRAPKVKKGAEDALKYLDTEFPGIEGEIEEEKDPAGNWISYNIIIKV